MSFEPSTQNPGKISIITDMKIPHGSKALCWRSLLTALKAAIVAGPIVLANVSADALPTLFVQSFTPNATTATCNVPAIHPGGPYLASNCTSTALLGGLASMSTPFIVGNFDGTPPTTQNFATTFSLWNNAHGNNWTLINGGDLDVTFTVTETATANADLGGINPFIIRLTQNPGYLGPPIGQLVWTQALYNSYSPKPPFPVDLNPPLNTLDTWSTSEGNTTGTELDINGNTDITNAPFLNPCQLLPGDNPGPNNNTPAVIGANASGKGYCDPIYPFQDGAAGFFDAPRSFWPDESFRAIALLSTVTFLTNAEGLITGRNLTVYDGVSWGFDLSVPEPAALLLFGPFAALLVFLRHRSRASHRPAALES